MKRTLYLSAAAGLALLALLLFGRMPGSDPAFTPPPPLDPALAPYVAAYTTGDIARRSPVRVRFTEPQVAEATVGQDLGRNPFQFEPALAGVARWEDRHTLAFFPEGPLPSGTRYRAELDLRAVVTGIDPALGTMAFAFRAQPQAISVSLTGTGPGGSGEADFQQVSGVLRTVDYEALPEIERLLQAQAGGKPVKVRWEHDEATQTHRFVVDSLPRGDQPYAVRLSWNGAPLDLPVKGEETVYIPPRGLFRHMHTYAYDGPEPYLTVEFSDPLKAGQDLSGLIRLGEAKLRYRIEGNRVQVFPTQRPEGEQVLRIEPGIESLTGHRLDQPYQEQVVFNEVKPEVRLIGKGNILPRSEKLPFVFEAIGLKAVDVRIIKVYARNVPQFLQVNQLDGDRELKRVGQVVAQQRIALDRDPNLDLNTWNRHAIDLAPLIDSDPGAVYEVALAFRRSYAYYECAEVVDPADDKDLLDVGEGWYTFNAESEYSYWDYWYYDYEDREDPCKPAYYNSERVVRRNVLASDLGLIAKAGSGGASFAVTDLKTTQPLAGVKLEVFDYQHQLIGTFQTGDDGTVTGQLTRPPFLLVASKGAQRGYLRMDDGSSLSLSRFDTQGKKYFRGVKGFLYGERGVWRPGDPMFINFILEDKAGTLPANHPVTFELTDSRGNLVEKIVRTEGENGFYAFHTQTAADAPTGNYRAKVRVGGAEFSETFKVETIIPNRLKIELDFGLEALSQATRDRQAALRATWLHGAIARSLKADVTATLQPATTAFPRYRDFIFDDPVRDFNGEETTLFEGRLDEQGVAMVPARLSAQSEAAGMLRANLVAKVYEPGGAFSIDRFSIPFHPYNTYVGLKTPKGDVARGMLLTDTDHPIQIVTVDTEGRPVSSEVEVTLYKLNWKWWWDQSPDNIGSYQGKVSADQIATGRVRTTNGEGVWTMNVKYPQWGRYLVRAVDKAGHATGKIIYIDWPGWAGRASDDERGAAAMLNFTADKERYAVGEKVTLNIPTGSTGRVLVSLENGTRVLQTYWVDAAEGMTRFTFTATPEMAPNIYAHVSLLQPHSQTANDLPIRLYGVVPLAVEDPQTHLQPVLAMADELAPNSAVNVRVSEADGRPMTYTLAMVDEGLLGLTRFQTPDPWQRFYQREALDVKTWDIFDQVLGAYGGEIKSMLSIGGDAGDQGPSGKKPDRFKPVVEFLGPFTLPAGQSQTHTIQLPNYIGAVRTMVVAGTPKAGAYGATEKSTPVKTPLMVLGTLPRVLGPGETVQVPVTVFAMDEDIRQVNLRISAGKELLIESDETQVLRFNGAGEKVAIFELGVLSTLGTTSVRIEAQAGGERAVYETDIQIRNPNPPITDVVAATLEKNQTWNQAYQAPGMTGTQSSLLEVSALPPLNLGRRLEYLLGYPFGCIEQSTSAGFPLVYLPDLMQLDPAQRDKVDSKVRATINRIKLFQTPSGGFAYWPGQNEPSDWGSNYAGHFLVEAQKAGYTVPANLLDNWQTFMRDRARAWTPGTGNEGREEEMNQAYRLFLLALAGRPEVGAMNRLRSQGALYIGAQWNLAAAYHLAGQPEVAKQLTRQASTDVPTYTELNGTFGSQLRDQAIILQAMSLMDRRSEAKGLVEAISARLASQDYLNTQATAYALVAMARYAGRGGVGAGLKFAYRVGGGAWVEVSSEQPVWQADLGTQRGTLELRNRGGAMIHPRLVLRGIPMQGDTSSASRGLAMSVAYTDLSGSPLRARQLEQGTDFLARVTVQNTGLRDYEQMSLAQIFPPGWEIINTRLDGNGPRGDVPTYQDLRDDRVYTFYDLKKGESKTFIVVLNAAYQGRYYLPTVVSEAMYDPSIHARVGGEWVRIVAAGTGG